VNTEVHFSSKTDDWATPQDFFDKLDEEFDFTLDVCATAENTKCAHWISKDSLSKNWAAWSHGALWMNPPYGRQIGKWVAKAHETGRTRTIVCLLPARTDTKWWHEYVIASGAEVRFVKGRLKFGGAKNGAPFPSAVVVFRPA
jgi:phage N-6-adenine-methyltransferase